MIFSKEFNIESHVSSTEIFTIIFNLIIDEINFIAIFDQIQ